MFLVFLMLFLGCDQELISRFWPVWPTRGNTSALGHEGPEWAQKAPLTLKILCWGVFGDYSHRRIQQRSWFWPTLLFNLYARQQDHSLISKNSVHTSHVQTR